MLRFIDTELRFPETKLRLSDMKILVKKPEFGAKSMNFEVFGVKVDA
jgi:hypothetical protein